MTISLNGLLFWHGVMRSQLLIVDYRCSQCHLIIITYQCEKVKCWHNFCWSLQGGLEVPFVLCMFRSLFSEQWASSSSHLLMQHLDLLVLCDELLLQVWFVATPWPFGFVCSFICFVSFVFWNWSYIFLLTFNFYLQH